ncbi:MAG: class I SAM-dependent methyltransferase [Bacteroidetes bacterium]|nr:class I SAM-dependent methyltransferase [Bacteroidota bacterium]
MSKLKKFLEILKAAMEKPYLLNLVIQNQEYQESLLKKSYPQQQALPQISLDDLGIPLETSVDSFLLDGSSMITDLALLKTLAQGKNSYFEIGTWRGESVWNVAKILEDCTTLNLSMEEMKKMNLNTQYIELHGILSKRNPKIKHWEGNTLNFNFEALQKKYDLIFIDGDHSYAMVKNDTQKVFEHLVHENTVVVWHDYAYNPEKIRHEVYRGILDGTPKKYHHKLYHIANSMCAVLLPGSFKTREFESPKKPNILFEIQVKPQVF